MTNLFLARADAGRNGWWRYLLGITSILLIWLIGSGLALFPLLQGGDIDSLDVSSPTGFALSLLGFAFLLLGTWGVNRVLHRRSVKSLTTGFNRVSWRRIRIGFGVWLVLASVMTVAEAVLFPSRFQWHANPTALLPYLAIGLLLIPVQTSAEEYFFRGYLLQATGRLLRNPVALALINGFLFSLPHLPNPEAQEVGVWLSVLLYGAMGFLLAYLTLVSQGLELALGVHAANNLFAGLLVSYEDDALSSPSLVTNSVIDPWFATISLLAMIAVILLALAHPRVKHWLMPELATRLTPRPTWPTTAAPRSP